MKFVKTETHGETIEDRRPYRGKRTDKRPDCKYYRAGKCIHGEHWKWCKVSDLSWFNFSKPLHPIWLDRVCEYQNPMEPAYFRITEEDIQALREGKILTIVSPSPFFIAMMEEEDGHTGKL